MRKVWNIHTAFVMGLVVAGSAIVASFYGDTAEARPNYRTAFLKKYPKVTAAKKAKCAICHIGKPKDEKWNDYGTALGKALGKEKASTAEVTKAFEKIEKEASSVKGKTFGDLLNEGKLPGNTP